MYSYILLLYGVALHSEPPKSVSPINDSMWFALWEHNTGAKYWPPNQSCVVGCWEPNQSSVSSVEIPDAWITPPGLYPPATAPTLGRRELEGGLGDGLGGADILSSWGWCGYVLAAFSIGCKVHFYLIVEKRYCNTVGDWELSHHIGKCWPRN